MIIGLLGLLDIHVAVLLVALGLGTEIPATVMAVTAILMFAKACLDISDIGSWQDLGAVILIVLSVFFVLPPWLLFIVAALIGFKGLSALAA